MSDQETVKRDAKVFSTILKINSKRIVSQICWIYFTWTERLGALGRRLVSAIPSYKE